MFGRDFGAGNGVVIAFGAPGVAAPRGGELGGEPASRAARAAAERTTFASVCSNSVQRPTSLPLVRPSPLAKAVGDNEWPSRTEADRRAPEERLPVAQLRRDEREPARRLDPSGHGQPDARSAGLPERTAWARQRRTGSVKVSPLVIGSTLRITRRSSPPRLRPGTGTSSPGYRRSA